MLRALRLLASGLLLVPGKVVPPPTGGGAGGVTLSVKSYGAKGDGTTDDTSAINAALTAGATLQGTVYFPKGNYVVTDTLVVPGSLGMQIRGDGNGYPNGSMITWQGKTEAAFDWTAPKPILWLKNCFGCTVEKLTLFVGTGYRAAEGVRITTQSGGAQVSTRNVFRNFGIGSTLNQVEIPIRIGGTYGVNPTSGGGTGVVASATDANNDFHSFEDCSFSNYNKYGMYLEDTQVYQVMLWNVLFQPAGIQTSATGAMTSGSATLTTASGLFTSKDTDKLVEVAGAGAAGVTLRSRISSITDATHVVLVNAASTTVGPTATISYGAQVGVYDRASSFEAHGGGNGAHLDADYFVGGAQPMGVLVEGFVNEGSRRLLATGGPSSGVIKHVILRDGRFSGDGVTTCGPANLSGTTGNDCNAITWNLGGGLDLENVELGDFGTSSPVKVAFSAGLDSSPWDENFRFTMKDSSIASSAGYPALFTADRPTLLGTNKLSGSGAVSGTGVDQLGVVPLPSPRDGSTVSGAQTVYWGQADARIIIIDGATTFTLADLPLGRSTWKQLWITHSGGPHALTWPVGTKSAGDVGTATANKTDMCELSYDGTNYYRRCWLGFQ